MDALGIYIFAGGFTHGLRQHANVVAHLEDKPYAGTETSRANFPDVPIFYRNSERGWPLRDFEGIDLVYCNPPCAIFSPIGISTTRGNQAWRQDVRLNCWLRCYQALDVNPKMLVIESVPQALTRGREMVDSLARDALSRGYSVTYLEHDAGNHGTPQHRRRFFFIAHKHALNLRPLNWAPVTTVGEALADVREPGWQYPLRPDIGEVYPHMRKRANGRWEGVRVSWCRLRGIDVDARGVPGMPMFMLHRLMNEHPAGVFCGNYWLHPDEPRYLGINEIKVLCGYPEDYELRGREGLWPSLLAQAVLPPVGEFVGASAARTLELGEKISVHRVWRRDIRRPEGGITDITAEVLERELDVPELLPEGRPPTARSPRARVGGIHVDHEWLDKQVHLLVEGNPRRSGSATYEIYQLYENGLRVRDFVERGGRLIDVKADIERGHIRLDG